jgi:hypothetical protein
MIDFVDLFHYLIGFIIVFSLVWIIVKIHIHFTKDNIPITNYTSLS